MPEIQISVKGIEKLLKSLNPHKAAGPDQFKLVVLQTLLHAEFAPILQVIFQKSLDSGKLPYIWKEVNISPIFKKGEKSDPGKLSPDITCVLCKVLEHIVASNLTKHLANSNILFELQHGFMEKRSCETQLIMLVEEIAKSMQSGKQIDLIRLDFSKAFDSCTRETDFKITLWWNSGQNIKLG